MAKIEGRVTAILITVIIHLIAGIIFMIVRIGSLSIKEYTKQYEVALQAEPQPEPRKDPGSVKGLFGGTGGKRRPGASEHCP